MTDVELTVAQLRLLRAAVDAGELGVRLVGAAWLPAHRLIDLGLLRERKIAVAGVRYFAGIATPAGRALVDERARSLVVTIDTVNAAARRRRERRPFRPRERRL